MTIGPLIIEDATLSATGAERVYQRCEEMPIAHFEMWGNTPPPAGCVPAITAAWQRRRPGTLKNLKLQWCMHRSSDCVNPDTFLRPPVSQIIGAFRTGTLNIDRKDEQGNSDLSLATQLAKALPELPDRIYINNEAANGQWSWIDAPTDAASLANGYAEKVQAANDRNTEIVLAVLMDDSIRAKLPLSLQSIPKDEYEIIAAFQPDKFGTALHEQRQADWLARWNAIRLRSIRSLLVRSGLLGLRSRVYVSFAGNWKRYICDDNGHTIASIPMPVNLYANWQCYYDGNQALVRAASMADTPGAMLTFNADKGPDHLRPYLTNAAKYGAFLYTEKGPSALDSIADMLGEAA